MFGGLSFFFMKLKVEIEDTLVLEYSDCFEVNRVKSPHPRRPKDMTSLMTTMNLGMDISLLYLSDFIKTTCCQVAKVCALHFGLTF